MTQTPSLALLAQLQNDLQSTKQQLGTIHPRENNYPFRKMLLEDKLANLENEYMNELRSQHPPQHDGRVELAGNNQTSLPIVRNHRPQMDDTVADGTSSFAHRAKGNPNELADPFRYNEYFGGYNSTASVPSWNFGNLEDENSNPGTSILPVLENNSTSGSGSSPESSFLRPQKRVRGSLDMSNNSAAHPSKSMRTTPSPAVTGTTSPTSHSSLELPDDPDLLALLGGNPVQDLREMREEQKEQERLFRQREEQERADAEFARRLVEQENGMSFQDYAVTGSSLPGSSRPGSSVAPRTPSQANIDRDGRVIRPMSFEFSPSAVSIDNNTATNFKVEKPFAAYMRPSFQGSIGPVKNGSSSHTKLPDKRLADFIDLESDDFFNQDFPPVTDHPSSDLVEIDASAFGESNQKNRAESSATAAAAGNPYSNQGNIMPSTWAFSDSNLGQSIVNPAGNEFNMAYGTFPQYNVNSNYDSMPGGFGGSSVYGDDVFGSSDIIDLDALDPSPQYLAQDLFSRHGIDAEDPANQQLVSSYMDRIEYVANDPTRTAADIKTLLENIRPDEDLPPENREGTPEAMTYPLMEHQKLGLTWMKSMEEGSNKGGILADAMGLGKTIQALALLVSRRSSDPLCKTTLIVCPVALLKQWDREIHEKLKPNHRLKVYTYHGEKRFIKWDTLRTYDVVLTTFGTLGTEVKRREGIEMSKKFNPNWRPSGKSDYLPLLGDDCKWYRVIIDEAQCIKNKNTRAALGAALLQAQTRFCMTGTPMMNRVEELYSLIHFLRIKPYCDANRFSVVFTRPLKGHSESAKAKAMRQLQALLKAILLRRTKKSQIDGKPILNLPERTTNSDQARFSDDEIAFYRALESRTQLQFNKYLKAGTVTRNYANILVLLLRLRQACCHPHLIKDFAQASNATEVSSEDMQKLARELAPDVVSRIKEQCGLNEDGALECPVCMDMAENPTIFIPCGHNTCSECFARISDPSQAIADGNAAEGRNADVKCPNCRGRIQPSKIIDHNAFKRVFMPEAMGNTGLDDLLEEDDETTDDSETEDDDEEASDENGEDEDVDSKGNIKGFIVDDEEEESAIEDEGDDSYRAGNTPFEKAAKKKMTKRDKGKGRAPQNRPPRKTLAELKKEGMRNMKARKRYLKCVQKEWIPSAKTERTMELLRNIRENKDPKTKQCEKTIIFSQFTSLLDLLEVPILREGWDYRRYDGSMSAPARHQAVLDFSDKKDCQIMLVSLKAGNAGLNLTKASQVIILDPFWNPYIEEQAIDRAHRIGQQRPVHVHRILVPNTVEDRILALQEEKRKLIENALDEKASESIGRLGTRELGFLFDVPT